MLLIYFLLLRYDDQELYISELEQEITLLKEIESINELKAKEEIVNEEIENIDINRLATSTDDDINNSIIEENEDQKEDDLEKLYSKSDLLKILEEKEIENRRILDECNIKINQANSHFTEYQTSFDEQEKEINECNEKLEEMDELNENYLDLQDKYNQSRSSSKFWMQVSVKRLKIMKKRRIFDSIRLFSMMTIVLSKKRNSSKDKDKINRIDNMLDLNNNVENNKNEHSQKETYITECSKSRSPDINIPIDDKYNNVDNDELSLRRRGNHDNSDRDKRPVVETLQLTKRGTPRQAVDGSNLVTPRDEKYIQTPRQSQTSFLMVLASVQVFIWFIILLISYVYFEEFIIVHLPHAPQLSKLF
jgi:hypothetical protein